MGSYLKDEQKKNIQNFYPKDRPLIFGHRGSPTKIIENTIASFKKATEQGVDGLEFDIRLSKDKEIVIFHDSDLKRLAGVDKKIKHLTAQELKDTKLKQNEKIPLLEEIVPLIEKIKVVNIEIKSDGLFQGHSIVTPLIQFLDKQNIDEKCIVVAPQCLRDAREGGRGSWKYEELNEWLKQLKSTLPIDDKRIYLMGNRCFFP